MKKELRDINLDVGCNKYKHEGSIGIDPQKHQEVDVCCIAEYLPFRDNIFECAYVFDVMEHLFSPIYALKEICRTCNSVLISIPNVKYIGILLRYLFNKPCFPSEDHKYMWGIEEATNMLRVCGFKIKQIRYGNTHYHKRKFKFLPGHLGCHSLFVEGVKKF